jgi:flagellar basal-body rod modification protein FlgD
MPLAVGRTPESNKKEAVFTTKKDNSVLTSNDFLKLFVKELQSQDFTNPMDSSEMMNQITQFSNMQMMQSMADYSKSSYAVSLIGKYVTASTEGTAGATEKVSGTIDRVSLEGKDYVFYIGKKKFSVGDISEVRMKAPE